MLVVLLLACSLLSGSAPLPRGADCLDQSDACDAGLTCVEWLDAGERRASCEVPCDETTDCPDGQLCVTGERGRLCVDRRAL